MMKTNQVNEILDRKEHTKDPYDSAVHELLTTQIDIAFPLGVKEGIRLYAWWKDGIQYVGTTGRTLKEALEEIDKNAKD